MNTRYVLFNLREALEDLNKAIAAAEQDDEYSLEAWLPFVYRKINRAWNCKDMTDSDLEAESEKEFEKRCGFPEDLKDLVSDVQD